MVKWFYQQAGKLESLQLRADGLKKRVFSVTAFTKETEAALANFVLKAEKDGKCSQIPLREKKTRSKPAVWATIHRAGFGRMMEVDNSYIDKIMEDYGAEIVKPTERQTRQGTPYWTGRVLLEIGVTHIPRQLTLLILYRVLLRDCHKTHSLTISDNFDSKT